MRQKLYALGILIGTLGLLTLGYLYFFVYYTAILHIQANEDEYSVTFFSKSTAQKRVEQCSEAVCEITDVSPFEYTITFSKEGYESIAITSKIIPRKKQDFIINFEKKAILEEVLDFTANETAQQKIQRLREENRYIASFALDENTKISFQENGEKMQMLLRTTDSTKEITSFPQVLGDEISVSSINNSQKIFLSIAGKSYIFDVTKGALSTLPFEIKVLYIKPGQLASQYLIVTQKGTFLYDLQTQKSEFQYQFKDFVYWKEGIIGVIYTDEAEKKKNFDLTQKGNLVVYYTQSDKRRKVLLATELKIDHIQVQDNKIIVSSGETNYELKNF